jgi:gentisate 1,2-dioxygenase
MHISTLPATVATTMSQVKTSTSPLASERQLMLRTAEANHTKPLWPQMSRLNPPLPNPRCQPYLWEYAQIRPSLLKAGDLVAEKQAERRVLMLVNPSRGGFKTYPAGFFKGL